jgi:drug/metabolite transporter (DMT)-like permease
MSVRSDRFTFARLRLPKAALPYLALLAGVLSLSFSTIFVRWANAPGIVMAFGRMSVATLAVAPFFWRHMQKSGRRFSRSDLLLVLAGGTLIAFDHGSLNTSLQFTRVANGTLFNNISPLWVALIAWLLWKEKLTARFWLGLAITLIGMVLVFGSSMLRDAQFNIGDAIAVGSSLFYALYFLVTQRARRSMETLVYIWPAVATAAIVLLVMSQIAGMPLTGYPTETYLAFLAAGLFSQVIGYFSVGYALGHLPASIVAPTMTAQPLLTMLLAVPLTGEGLMPLQIGGALVVMVGIYLVNRQGKQVVDDPPQRGNLQG